MSKRPRMQQIGCSHCATVSTYSVQSGRAATEKKTSLFGGKFKCAPRDLSPAPGCSKRLPRPPTPQSCPVALPAQLEAPGPAGGRVAHASPRGTAPSPPPAPPPQVRGAGEDFHRSRLAPKLGPADPRGTARSSGDGAAEQPERPLYLVAGARPGREGARACRGRGPPRLPAQREPGSRGSFWKPRPEERSPPVRPPSGDGGGVGG